MKYFIIESNNIRHDTGLGFIVDNVRDIPSDDIKATKRSGLLLLEDGFPLGPPHSGHQDIRENGGGQYSHWKGYLLFSSSDGSDPRTNGRRYSYTSLEHADKAASQLYATSIRYLIETHNFPLVLDDFGDTIDAQGITRLSVFLMSQILRRTLFNIELGSKNKTFTLDKEAASISGFITSKYRAEIAMLSIRNKSASPATITGVRSHLHDTHWSCEDLVAAIKATAGDDRAKAFALWRYISMFGVRGTADIHPSQRRDPMLFLWVYGGDCNDFAHVYCQLAERLGLKSRIIKYDGHAAVEVWFDDRWNLLDPNLSCFYRDEHNQNLFDAESVVDSVIDRTNYGYPFMESKQYEGGYYKSTKDNYSRIIKSKSYVTQDSEKTAHSQVSIQLKPDDEIVIFEKMLGTSPIFFTRGNSIVSPGNPLPRPYRYTHTAHFTESTVEWVEASCGLPVLDARVRLHLRDDDTLGMEPLTFIIVFDDATEIPVEISTVHYINPVTIEFDLGHVLSLRATQSPSLKIKVGIPEKLTRSVLSARFMLIGSIQSTMLPSLKPGVFAFQPHGTFDKLEMSISGVDFIKRTEKGGKSQTKLPYTPLVASTKVEDVFIAFDWNGEENDSFLVEICTDPNFYEPILAEHINLVSGRSYRVSRDLFKDRPALHYRITKLDGDGPAWGTVVGHIDLPQAATASSATDTP
ncbi:transglutaminase-like domain-containing protein [Asticcacaulis sp.]|uniref:transglutaminase-like domain-containing protein n=1 Tax=Asticcacaulis sp. TaxID=1872648 RepID=UPI00260831A4|nr:transglutaminase-like domain-containing protein [Asticcacaulis sp.]